MPLDDLVSVIETLQQRIKDHGDSLRQNETRTRMALIDPLLTALGWDVANPSLVTPEYRVDVGWADYALQGLGNKPSAIVEAKRLGAIVENHLEQAVNYCIQQGIAYAAVTDGSHWQLYRTFDPVPLNEKRVLDVDIAGSQPHECALQFLLLWRPNLATGKAIPANEPTFTPLSVPLPIVDTIESETYEPTTVDQMPVMQLNEKLDGVEWINLSQYRPKSGDPAPNAVLFPTGEERPVGRHKRLLIEVAEYLIRIQQLTAVKCPIGNGRVKYLVNSVQIHKDGSNFRDQYLLSNGLHLETKDPAPQTTNSARFLLQHFGQDPASIRLKLS